MKALRFDLCFPRPDFVQTWPEPAQAPSNFTFVELTAYNVSETQTGSSRVQTKSKAHFLRTFTFEPGLGLDCTWASWQAGFFAFMTVVNH